MSWNMGEREAVRAWLAGSVDGRDPKAEAAAAEMVANALLRAVGRQAIIAAAADAVAALGCGGGPILSLPSATVKPGGGQEGDAGDPMQPPNP